MTNKKEELKEKDKGIPTTKYLDSKYIVETIYNEKLPKYAILNGKIEIANYLKFDKTFIVPYKDPFNNLDKGSILLPTNVAEYGSTEKLIEDIKNFISKYCYMPEFWVNVSAHYALLSWIFERFESIPYLEFLGDKDSGKTRIGKTISECCYNTVKMNGAGSIPVLFRLIDRYRGTIFIDEADYRNSEFDSELAKIINCGYTKDGAVWRVDQVDHKYEPRAFGVYGPKILSHREPYKDDATRSRCISFVVPKESQIPKHIPIQLPFEFNTEGEIIRNKCLKWRFDNLRSFKPDLNLGIDLASRYREITIPLLNLIKDDVFSKELIEFILSSSKDSRGEGELYICVESLSELAKESKNSYVTPQDIAVRMTEKYCKNGDEKHFTPKKAGYYLTLLGFDKKDKKRVGGGIRLELNSVTRGKIKALGKNYALVD